MASFEVAPDELDKCADLLDRFTDDADAVRTYLRTYTGLTPNAGGGMSFYAGLVAFHAGVCGQFDRRAGLLWECADSSAAGMRSAAAWYRETDTDNAGYLDTTYPPVSRDRLSTEDGEDLSPVAAQFKDVADPDAALNVQPGEKALMHRDGSGPNGRHELDQPKESQIEETTRGIVDRTSAAWWLRQLLQSIFGFDPFDYIKEVYAGKWTDWGKCATVWRVCGDSVDAMRQNLAGVDEGLAQTWSGNAADGAMSYFQQLTTATSVESTAYHATHDVYMAITDVVYQGVQNTDDLVNFLIDTIIFAPLDVLKLPEIASKAWEIWDMIGTVITGVFQGVNDAQATTATGELRPVPPTQLDGLTVGYDHPSKEA